MRNYLLNYTVLTEEQASVLDGPSNVIVNGAAGTGKTMLTILLAKKYALHGKVGVIIYTKALRKFIAEAIDNKNVDIFNASWEEYCDKEYDCLLIDECQDFTPKEIKAILEYNCKRFYFFGDDEQQLYERCERKATLENICQISGFPVVELSKNLRLSQPVVSFLKGMLPNFKIGSAEYNDSDILPDVEHFDSLLDEKKYIADMITTKLGGTIGVILNSNENVTAYALYLQKHVANKRVGYKNKTVNSLILGEEESVNVLTFHSSKGLEFDHVIIPNGGFDDGDGRCMYVGSTRARYSLILTDNGNGSFRINPSNLYNGDSHKNFIRSFDLRHEIFELDLELLRANKFYEVYSETGLLNNKADEFLKIINAAKIRRVELTDEFRRITGREYD